MVILNEYDSSFLPCLFQNRRTELFIDCFVLFPVGSTEDRASVGDVTQGPERIVGQPVIVSGLFPTR